MIFTDYSRIKSAVAFFFLFFLHGISIGTRQQGISYNVSQPCDGGEIQDRCQQVQNNN